MTDTNVNTPNTPEAEVEIIVSERAPRKQSKFGQAVIARFVRDVNLTLYVAVNGLTEKQSAALKSYAKVVSNTETVVVSPDHTEAEKMLPNLRSAAKSRKLSYLVTPIELDSVVMGYRLKIETPESK